MLPQNLGSETNIKLPFSFIIFAFLALLASQLLLLFNGSMFAMGAFRIPHIWASAHLLVLGWALMAAMGAMYQLVPVAFLTKIWNEKFGFVQFFLTGIGIGSFAITLYLAPQDAVLPGTLTLLGILMFLFQMFMTLKKQEKPTILTAFIGTALVCLLATISLGITLIYLLSTGAGAAQYQSIFESHLLFGVAGWFTLLIFGFSYKMIPMFSLAHGFPMVQARYVYGFYVTGLIVSLISFLTGHILLLKAGFFLLFVGFTAFTWHIRLILKKRLRKKLDRPFVFAIYAIGFGNIVHLAAFLLLFTGRFTSLIGPFLYSYLLLWIVLSLIGYLYKIVPFLWWTFKYSEEIGKNKVPALKEMINDKIINPYLILFIAGVLLVFISLLLQATVLFIIGQVIVSVVLVLVSISILMVLKK